MNKFPKVSIILGAYKEEKVIGKTLKHLVTQVKYPNLEILVAVDTYEDKTIDIVKEYARKYRKIKLDFSRKRRGVVKALSSLLKKARGEIIFHFGSDFRFYNPSKCLFNLIEYFSEPTVGAVIVDIRDPKPLEKKMKLNINTYAQLMISKLVMDWRRQKYKIISGKPEYPLICHSFRRKLVNNLDERSINDDAEFAYSVLDKGYKIVFAKNLWSYSISEPMTSKGFLLRGSRTAAGWFKIAEKRKLKPFKYYLSLFEYFITHLHKYKFSEIGVIIYALPLYVISIIDGYRKRNLIPTKTWVRYERFKQ